LTEEPTYEEQATLRIYGDGGDFATLTFDDPDAAQEMFNWIKDHAPPADALLVELSGGPFAFHRWPPDPRHR
jgi:hypothetical protein